MQPQHVFPNTISCNAIICVSDSDVSLKPPDHRYSITVVQVLLLLDLKQSRLLAGWNRLHDVGCDGILKY
jgi:hypothetical protein